MMQFALEPLWKLYEACSLGADVKNTLSKAVKSLGLSQVNSICIQSHLLQTSLLLVYSCWQAVISDLHIVVRNIESLIAGSATHGYCS